MMVLSLISKPAHSHGRLLHAKRSLIYPAWYPLLERLWTIHRGQTIIVYCVSKPMKYDPYDMVKPFLRQLWVFSQFGSYLHLFVRCFSSQYFGNVAVRFRIPTSEVLLSVKWSAVADLCKMHFDLSDTVKPSHSSLM